MPRALIFMPRLRPMVSSMPITTGPLGSSRSSKCSNRRRAKARVSQRARFSGGDPGGETGLELFGIEGGEDAAQVIMPRRAVGKGAQPAQKRKLRLAEQGDLGDMLCPRQGRCKAQQQDLIQRIVFYFPPAGGDVIGAKLQAWRGGYRGRHRGGTGWLVRFKSDTAARIDHPDDFPD